MGFSSIPIAADSKGMACMRRSDKPTRSLALILMQLFIDFFLIEVHPQKPFKQAMPPSLFPTPTIANCCSLSMLVKGILRTYPKILQPDDKTWGCPDVANSAQFVVFCLSGPGESHRNLYGASPKMKCHHCGSTHGPSSMGVAPHLPVKVYVF